MIIDKRKEGADYVTLVLYELLYVQIIIDLCADGSTNMKYEPRSIQQIMRNSITHAILNRDLPK